MPWTEDPVVTVALGAGLAGKLGPLRAELERRLQRLNDGLLAGLGLAPAGAVRIEGDAGVELVAAAVSGVPVGPCDRALWEARCGLGGGAGPRPEDARGLLADWASQAEPDRVAEWVVRCVAEATARRCELLLTRAAVEQYLRALPEGEPVAVAPEVVAGAFATALELGVSLGDRPRVAELLRDPPPARHGTVDAEALAERLVDGLAPGGVEIAIDPRYLEQIALQEPDREVLGRVRDGLWEELGLVLPPIRFVPDTGVGDRAFAFRLNQLPLPRRQGIAPGSIWRGEPGDPCALPPEARGGAEPLTPLAHLGQWLAVEARRNAPRLVRAWIVERHLGIVEGELAPRTVEAARDRFGVARLTRVLRNLAAEGVPISDVKGIAAAALEFEVVDADPSLALLDDRLPWPVSRDPRLRADPATPDLDVLTSFVRTRLKRVISDTARRGREAVPVHLLSSGAEKRIREAAMQYRAEHDVWGGFPAWFAARGGGAVRGDVRAAVRSGDRAAAAVLTSAAARPWLWQLVKEECAGVQVLAFEEVAPKVGFEVLETIGSAEPAEPEAEPAPEAVPGPGEPPRRAATAP